MSNARRPGRSRPVSVRRPDGRIRLWWWHAKQWLGIP